MLFVCRAALAGQSQDDRAVLADVLQQVAPELCGAGGEWDCSADAVCQIPGVGCDPQGYVTLLDLSGNGLTGTIPEALGELTQLTQLDLNGNHLRGAIPAKLAELAQLCRMDLRGNHLSGSVPQEFGRLTRLRHLNLSYNQLNGRIPESLQGLPALNFLDLRGNRALIPPVTSPLVAWLRWRPPALQRAPSSSSTASSRPRSSKPLGRVSSERAAIAEWRLQGPGPPPWTGPRPGPWRQGHRQGHGVCEMKAVPGALQLNPKAQAGNWDVRTDRVCYIREQGDPSSPAARLPALAPGLLHCHRLLRGLASDLEGRAGSGALDTTRFLVPDWTQLAMYAAGGGFYTWHSDGMAFPASYWLMGPFALVLYLRWAAIRRRTVTAILYLNGPEAWQPNWGGALRCRAPAVCLDPSHGTRELPRTADGCAEILPQGGRLVLFSSQDVEHEVAATRRERWALTLWLHR